MTEGTRYVDRAIPKISLKDFAVRVDEITTQLCDAAENVGFFAIVDHGIATSEIDTMFATSEAFFSLPEDIKGLVPWNSNNVGWENKSQIRPSTGAPDMKESYQLQFGDNMRSGGGPFKTDSMWLSDEHLPGFQSTCLDFMHRLQALSKLLMVCFARGLGFPDDYFIRLHDADRPDSQTVLRLLHYYPTPTPTDSKVHHRAGAHTDWGFLTLLFQRPGQPGLEICPGKEANSEFALDDPWTRVEFDGPDTIICNIGDLLMSWSDDRFKSTFHRVKAPCEPGDYFGEWYSIAFFNQPCKDAVIQGPRKKYPSITGEQFIQRAMQTHFAALQEKLKRQAEEGAGV
ncbi:oxoglutarate/iron-dependent oxygenase [Diplogelasinospora grovesii]|uniref:Oxoglutarate/iron-dependent oxygenase n=1 Tax=Diplogelasinospora grovesii TaxID=303347 RepID=A0AAN6N2S1_9PEZI|nr:oxoglutarate/iron-dependent oxygenase [Diplogelasinospora grovesii]